MTRRRRPNPYTSPEPPDAVLVAFVAGVLGLVLMVAAGVLYSCNGPGPALRRPVAAALEGPGR